MAKALAIIEKFKGMKRVENNTSELPANYFNLLQNYYFKDGVLVRRTGCTKRNSTSTGSQITSIKEVVWDDASKSIIVSSGDKWYNGGTSCATMTQILDKLSQDKPIDVSQFKINNVGHAIISSEATNVKKYDKTTVSDLGAIAEDFNTLVSINNVANQNGGGGNVIDSNSEFAYYTYIGSGPISYLAKVRLSDFTIVATKQLQAQEISHAMVIDPSNTFMYIANTSINGGIEKVDLTTLSNPTVGVGTGLVGIIRNICISPNGGFLYASIDTDPVTIIKLDLSDFSTITTKVLTGYNYTTAMCIDPNSQYLYIECKDASTGQPNIAKLLGNFSTVAYTPHSSGTGYADLVVNPTNTHIYGAYTPFLFTSPEIRRISIADLTVTEAVSGTPGDGASRFITIDRTGTFVYITTDANPSVILKATTADFTPAGTYRKIFDTATGRAYRPVIDYNKNFLYVPSGDNVQTYSRLSLSVNPKFTETHHNKAWFFSFMNNAYRIISYFSATDLATDYVTAGDAGRINFGNVLSKYDTPTGLKSWGEYIIFGFLNNILIYYANTDPNDFRIVKHIQGTGVLSNNMQIFGNDLLYASRSGIRSLNSSIQSGEINYNNFSKDIDSLWTTNITSYPNDTERIYIKYDKIRNLVIISSNSSNSSGISFYVYSVNDKVWSVFSVAGLGGANITCMETTEAGEILFGTSDGYVYELFSGATDNGSAIDYKAELVVQNFGQAHLNKKIKYIDIITDGASQTLDGTVDYYVDQIGTMRTETVEMDAGTDYGSKYSGKVAVNNRGKSWYFRFNNCGNIRKLVFYGEAQGDK